MPSPLSGLTHAAASPMSIQLGPDTPVTAPPIGSSADVSRAGFPVICHSSPTMRA